MFKEVSKLILGELKSIDYYFVHDNTNLLNKSFEKFNINVEFVDVQVDYYTSDLITIYKFNNDKGESCYIKFYGYASSCGISILYEWHEVVPQEVMVTKFIKVGDYIK